MFARLAKPVLPAALFAAALALPGAVQAQDDRPSKFYPDRFSDGTYCLPAVERQLIDLGIPGETIESVYFDRREQRDWRSHGSTRRIIGYDAYVRPKNVKGYLVLQLFVNCEPQQAYTRGAYRVAGLPAY